ncbi:MAG: hypothetical protein EBZ59_11465, partial [Planctomycetia bacterium]|nr:hypothetical protein [Planctomycetia bacterium]
MTKNLGTLLALPAAVSIAVSIAPSIVLPGAAARSVQAHPGHEHDPVEATPVTSTSAAETASPAPVAAAPFAAFAASQAVRCRWDDRYLYVESNGMPAHRMMVGITAWQQQVP